MFLSATAVPGKLCQIEDGMKKPALIPKENIKTSTTKKGKKPTDVRPGGRVWTSNKQDKKPKIEITLGKKPVPTKSVKVIKTRNVKKVTVVFVLPKNKKVTKVNLNQSLYANSLPRLFTSYTIITLIVVKPMACDFQF